MSTIAMTPALLDGQAQSPPTPLPADAVRIAPAQVDRALYLAGGLTSLFALIGLLGAVFSETQFAFSYLTAFLFAVSIAIGSLFWLMIHHLTSAGWSVVVRRLFENLTLCLPVMPLLFLPIALSLPWLYGWMDADANAGDPLWQAKHGYLNAFWFIIRAAVYLICWAALAWRMRSWSVRQDQSGEPAITAKLGGVSSWGMAILALTSTYAAFDWLMSLDYRWYSTMYGVTSGRVDRRSLAA